MDGMRDAARVTIAEGAAPVGREAWLAFCAENGLAHSPGVLGGQAFHSAGVRASFAPPGGNVYRTRRRADDAPALAAESREIVFSTYPGSPELQRLAFLARRAQARFGGRIEAGAEVRRHMPG